MRSCPSFAAGVAPASRPKVSRKSTVHAGASIVRPASMTPGHVAMPGTRMPPSKTDPLRPRRPAVESKNGVSTPPTSWVGPLSLVRKMSVSSARPAASIAARIAPTSSSSREIIAA